MAESFICVNKDGHCEYVDCGEAGKCLKRRRLGLGENAKLIDASATVSETRDTVYDALLDASRKLRIAQNDYMANRGNEEKGRAVANAARVLDIAIEHVDVAQRCAPSATRSPETVKRDAESIERIYDEAYRVAIGENPGADHHVCHTTGLVHVYAAGKRGAASEGPSATLPPEARKLLEEGANGFGRVLVATSDQEASYGWAKRCRVYLDGLK